MATEMTIFIYNDDYLSESWDWFISNKPYKFKTVTAVAIPLIPELTVTLMYSIGADNVKSFTETNNSEEFLTKIITRLTGKKKPHGTTNKGKRR